MSWAEKVSNKKYIFGTLVNIGLSAYAGYPKITTIACLVFVSVSAALNHLFTVMALSDLVNQASGKIVKVRKWRLVIYLALKAIFFVAGFVCLMVFAPDAVVYGLFVFTFQLIILCLSIKNIGSFYKKGPFV